MGVDPDGLTGSLLAVESIPDARAVLNGPGGCRHYHSFLSEVHHPRSSRDRPEFIEPFFFGQPRVPCTYLDEDDYIRGSAEKMECILPSVERKGDSLAVVINAPGAALIGDDLEGVIARSGLSEKVLAIEGSTFSAPLSTSYDATIRSVLEWLDPPRVRREAGCVNLLGLPITNKDWKHAVAGLRLLLGLMGLKVISAPGAGCTVEELRGSVKASCNIVVSPEYASATADLYRERYGIPCVTCEEGAPVGFSATESWLRAAASATGADPSEALVNVKHHREISVQLLREFQSHTTLPKGATFAVKADSSVALPLVKWLLNYLGMVPASVQLSPGACRPMAGALRSFLEDSGFGDAWEKSIDEARPDVALADGHTARLMKGMGACRVGVDISLPSLERFDFIPRSIFGPQGAMYLLDEIVNGL